MAKKTKRKKHLPQRTCVGCRAVQEKRSLIRIVRTPQEAVQVDENGKLHGRGAYLHNQRSCWRKGLDGKLAPALKTTLTPEDVARLTTYMEQLPAEDLPAEN